jgi:hypothetical protein
MNMRDSFDMVSERWYSELNHYVPDASIIVVGLRWDKDVTLSLINNPVSTQEALDLCKKINAYAYIESSIVTASDVLNAFNVAVTTGTSTVLKQNGITNVSNSNHIMKHLTGTVKYFNETLANKSKRRLSSIITSLFQSKPDKTIELGL